MCDSVRFALVAQRLQHYFINQIFKAPNKSNILQYEKPLIVNFTCVTQFLLTVNREGYQIFK